MISTDQVLTIIDQIGPSLPTQITSRTGQNTMIVGAILSTLIAEKRLFVTHAKWGGSPLYYTQAQLEQIQKIYPQLNEKDRRAFDILKQQLIVEDVAQTPLVRACLRQLKDFAIALKVTAPNGDELLFWKWYMLSDEQAHELIGKIIVPRYETAPAPKPVASVQQKIVSASTNASPVAQQKNPSVATVASAASVSKPVVKPQSQVSIQASSGDDEFIGTPMIAQKQKASSKPTSAPVASTPTFQASLPHPLPTGDDFFTLISSKLAEKQVSVISATVIKKNSELDLIVSMPTPFGSANYYAKAKKKKKSTDADLSSTYVKGQMLHLPCAYISLGELTKKAQGMLKTDFSGMLIVSLSE